MGMEKQRQQYQEQIKKDEEERNRLEQAISMLKPTLQK